MKDLEKISVYFTHLKKKQVQLSKFSIKALYIKQITLHNYITKPHNKKLVFKNFIQN